MKAFTYIIIALVILGVGYLLFMGGDEMADENVNDAEMNESEDTTNEDTEDITAEGEVSLEGDVIEGEEVVIDISGTNFEFDVEEITVTEGDVVTINFTSESGFHDWVVDEFDAATAQVNAGGTTSVTFVADAAGTYEYYCSVGNHREQGMVGTLVVEERPE